MSRKWIYIAGGIVAVFLLILVSLPLFVNVNSYRPKIESMLSTSMNRKVTLGNIGLSIFSGGVAVNDVAISDDPAFSRGNFLTAQSITVGVKLMPLIFSKQLEVTGITVQKPAINLVRSASGNWNFSTIGSSSAASAAPASPSPSNSGSNSGSSSSAAEGVSVARMNIRDGQLSILMEPGNKPLVYDKLNLEVSDLSYTTQFPFQFSVETPGGGTVKLSGKAGPLNQANVQQTPMQASLDVHNLDVAATGFVDAASGIAGRMDFTGNVDGDGKTAHSKGSVTAAKLQLVPGSAPATQPVKLDYDVNFQMPSLGGVLNQGDIHIGKATAHLGGTFNAAGKTPSVQMHLNGEGMPLSDLQGVLPAVNVALPSGTSLSAGTMNLNLAIAGPTDHLVISGPINMSNATLAGYDMGSKIGVLGPFAGVKKSPNTVIQTFSTDLRMAAGAINANKIDLVVDGIGAITGSGTVSADQSLNFKMAANLSGGALGDITKFASVGNKNGGGIPFTIRGTTSNPSFLPDVGGVAGGLASGLGGAALGGGKGAAAGVEGLGGLFGKKK